MQYESNIFKLLKLKQFFRILEVLHIVLKLNIKGYLGPREMYPLKVRLNRELST